MEQGHGSPENYFEKDKLELAIEAMGFQLTPEQRALYQEALQAYGEDDGFAAFNKARNSYGDAIRTAFDETTKHREDVSDVEANYLAQVGLLLTEARLFRDCGEVESYYEALVEVLWLADNFQFKSTADTIRQLLEEIEAQQ